MRVEPHPATFAAGVERNRPASTAQAATGSEDKDVVDVALVAWFTSIRNLWLAHWNPFFKPRQLAMTDPVSRVSARCDGTVGRSR